MTSQSSTLIESINTLFQGEPEAFVGCTSAPAIPLPLSSRQGGKLKASAQEAILIGCGASSKGLSALLLRGQEAADRFCAANPLEAKTLVTRALGGDLAFWFYCAKGAPPEVVATNHVWCSNGMIPLAWVGEKLDDRIVRKRTILEVRFDDFNWDAEVERDFRNAKLIAVYGPLLQQVGPEKWILNDLLVCRIFAADMGVYFMTEERRFSTEAAVGDPERLSEEAVLRMLTAWLEQVAANSAGYFPLKEIRFPRLRSIIESLKLVTATSWPDARGGLLKYVKVRLCVRPGTSLTTQEIQADYFRNTKQSSQLPVYRFQRELPGVIRETFGALRVHNIARPKHDRITNRRGFNSLAFQDDLKRSDGPDAADGDARADVPDTSDTSDSTQVPSCATRKGCSGDD